MIYVEADISTSDRETFRKNHAQDRQQRQRQCIVDSHVCRTLICKGPPMSFVMDQCGGVGLMREGGGVEVSKTRKNSFCQLEVGLRPGGGSGGGKPPAAP